MIRRKRIERRRALLLVERAQIERIEKLRKYTRHDAQCALSLYGSSERGGACNCGLEQALQLQSEAEPSPTGRTNGIEKNGEQIPGDGKRELPIIITPPERLKAIQEDRMTQFREVIPKIPPTYLLAKKPWSYGPSEYAFVDMADPVGTYPVYVKSRYRVGDKLWVKEAYHHGVEWDNEKPGRLWLRVIAVKDPHRIRDMKFQDFKAEGMKTVQDGRFSVGGRQEFIRLWNHLHPGPGERWEANPWVQPYVFERIDNDQETGDKT